MPAASGLSIHVVDVAAGRPAAGMRIDLSRLDAEPTPQTLANGARLDEAGKLVFPGDAEIGRGRYEVVFHVGAYYRGMGQALPALPFLDVLPLRFGIDDPGRHHHLPLKLTPWGCSVFLTR